MSAPVELPSRAPDWIRERKLRLADLHAVRSVMRSNGLHTVCEEARCPNRGECFSRGTATFLLLGDVCTRACGFCDIRTGRPLPVDPMEPWRVKSAVATMKLAFVVLTSVDRDDLPDGGAEHFAATIRALRTLEPAPGIEVLTPDFLGRFDSLRVVVDAKPDVFNHNVETVPRLYREVRRGARLDRSLGLLSAAKILDSGLTTKSGFMLGLGEREEEVRDLLERLAGAGVDIVTIGQYLRPVEGEPSGRRIRRPGRLRPPPRIRRVARFPTRFRGAVRPLVLPGGGGARRRLGRGVTDRLRAPAAGVLSGLLFALAFPPFEWTVLLPIALVPWLVALGREERSTRALVSGLVFGLAYWCASIPWIVYVVTHYGGQSGVMGIVCLILLALILAEWPALVAWGTVFAAPPGGWRFALFPLLWMASEHARTVVYKGFPWNLTAHALYRHPVWLQTASVWGVYGVGALAIALSALVAASVAARSLRPMLGAAVLVIAAGSFGAVRLAAPAQPAPEIAVALLQPNLSEESRATPEGEAASLPRRHRSGAGGRARTCRR